MISEKDTVNQVWERSGGVCECKRIGCQHPGGRCSNLLNERMFTDDDEGGWYVRKVNEFGPEKLFNVEAVCSKCHNKLTKSEKKEQKTISSDRSDSIRL